MNRFSRIEVIVEMKRMGVVPIFYHANPDICKKLVTACYEAGARVIEFTNRGDFAHETFAALSKFVKQEYPDLMLGAGSIVEGGTTSLYLQLGADFIVSPILNPEMARICNRRKVAWLPGCGTVSELSYAEELGAEVVKIYPAEQLGGPGFVKAIKGPMPWASVMATGGVSLDEDTLQAWMDAGVHCVGIGSRLFTKTTADAYDYTSITEKLSRAINFIQANKPI